MHLDGVRQLAGETLSTLCSEFGVPGASVAVSAGGDVTTAVTGVVNTGTQVAVTPDAIFQIQSITKLWTSTLIMQLVDEGLVDIDRPVVEVLPEFSTADPATAATITVRHLLTHTGGFEGDEWRPTTDDDTALERFVTDLVSSAPQHLPPGERFSYCSAGMGVLGRLVEVKRNLPFPAALRRQLAEPLGVEVAFDAAEALRFRAAIGHVDARPVQSWAYFPVSNQPAGAQLSMSAASLAAFGRMHAADGLAANGNRLLSAESARAMRVGQVPLPASDNEQGLGWQVAAQMGLVHHGGDALGVASFLCVVPEHDVVIALVANGGDAGQLVRGICDPLLRELTGTTLPKSNNGALPTVESFTAARYVGVYQHRNARAEVSSDEAGRLWLTARPMGEAVTMSQRSGVAAKAEPAVRLHHRHDDVFATVDDEGKAKGALTFFGDDDQARARFLHGSGRAMPRVG